MPPDAAKLKQVLHRRNLKHMDNAKLNFTSRFTANNR